MSEERPEGGTPPGWYAHPTMAGTQAYWDGRAWTDNVAPAAPASSPDQATGAAARVFLLLVALGAVVVLILIAAALVR